MKRGAVISSLPGEGDERIHVIRRCFGVELDPAYVDVVVERWERDTGLTAVRESDGLTIHEIRKQLDAGEVTP